MTPANLSAAIAGLVRVQSRHTDAAPDVSAALALLTAILEASTVPRVLPPRREALIAQLIKLEAAMRYHEPAQRREAICERMDISRSYYYELRADAVERGQIQ